MFLDTRYPWQIRLINKNLGTIYQRRVRLVHLHSSASDHDESDNFIFIWAQKIHNESDPSICIYAQEICDESDWLMLI